MRGLLPHELTASFGCLMRVVRPAGDEPVVAFHQRVPNFPSCHLSLRHGLTLSSTCERIDGRFRRIRPQCPAPFTLLSSASAAGIAHRPRADAAGASALTPLPRNHARTQTHLVGRRHPAHRRDLHSSRRHLTRSRERGAGRGRQSDVDRAATDRCCFTGHPPGDARLRRCTRIRRLLGIAPWPRRSGRCSHPKRTAMLVTGRIGFRRLRRGERHRPLSSWSRTWRRSTLPMRERGRSSTAVMRLGTL